MVAAWQIGLPAARISTRRYCPTIAGRRHKVIALTAALAALAVAAPAPAAVVRDGPARFEVLSPTLIRLEYASDRGFEDRPTLTAIHRATGATQVKTHVAGAFRVIKTSRLTLRWRRGSGRFGPASLTLLLRVGGRAKVIHPRFPPPPGPPPEPPSPPVRTQAPANPDPNPGPRTHGNLGGWTRGVDDQDQPVPLHDGVLSRDGWYVLDDSRSPLLTPTARGFATRPARKRTYQDGYLFAYGHRYGRALRDLRRLTGSAPLLPRRAFDTWFSRYWPYGSADLRALVARFRSARIPLGVLGIDTDFKAPVSRGAAVADTVLGIDPTLPYAWNGWDWNGDLFPKPAAFIRWLHSRGIAVDLNVHPSIGDRDSHWAATQQRAGGLIKASPSCNYFEADALEMCGVFDWTNPRHLDAYFRLHAPFERDGVDFWWLDWCCDESRAHARGMTEDTWVNSRYARRNFARGSRWPVFSRIGASYWAYFGDQEPGAFAEHRQTIHFTGDAKPTWELLDFESRLTAAEGSGIGLPYVSHDIGSFKGRHLADDKYVRWVQLGAFQPINRLHSDHGDRLPWQYTGKARAAAARFLRLRGSLVPLLYTLARRAHDSGLPIARAMYLQWPEREGAYRRDRQYMLGRDLLVAPVGKPGDPGRKTVWFPPGRWFDLFTGRSHVGPRVETLSVPLDRMPVFARGGSLLPLQDYTQSQRPPQRLTLDVWAGRRGSFRLYEDAGDGTAFERGAFAFTAIGHRGGEVTIGPARGRFAGQRAKRSWRLRLIGVPRPSGVTVNGRTVAFRYGAAKRTVVATTPLLSTARRVRIKVEP